MLARAMAFLLLFVTMAHPSHAEEAALRVGDEVSLMMESELAIEYARRSGWLKKDQAPHGLTVDVSVKVSRKLDDTRYQIECSNLLKGNDDQKDRLVTLTAIVDAGKIESDTIPIGTGFYSSPAAHKEGAKPVPSSADQHSRRLKLSKLDELRLRTWTLTDEIGDGRLD